MENEQLYNFCSSDMCMEYICFGKGKKVMLAFHGFARHCTDFKIFEKQLSDEYTVYSFNFFHHGNSTWPEDRISSNTLTNDELKAFFKKFFSEKNIHRFSLMGYSMGGKICFSLLHYFPNRIDEMYLMAPDGIKKNFWYTFSSRNWLGNSIYRRILQNPRPFVALANGMKNVGLLRKKLHSFVLNNIDTKEKRQQVYKVWMTLRWINPSAKISAKLISENKIHLHLFFGKHDHVIPSRIGTAFLRKINTRHSLQVVECGHNLMKEETALSLAQLLGSISKKEEKNRSASLC